VYRVRFSIQNLPTTKASTVVIRLIAKVAAAVVAGLIIQDRLSPIVGKEPRSLGIDGKEI
jgi:hypothetical protein